MTWQCPASVLSIQSVLAEQGRGLIWQLIFEQPHDRNGYYLALGSIDRSSTIGLPLVQCKLALVWRRRRSHEEDSWWITGQRRAGGPWCRARCVLLTTLSLGAVWLIHLYLTCNQITLMPTSIVNHIQMQWYGPSKIRLFYFVRANLFKIVHFQLVDHHRFFMNQKCVRFI